MKLRARMLNKGSHFLSYSQEQLNEIKKQKQLKEEFEQKQISEAKQAVAKQKSKKSKWSTLFMFLINILIIGAVLFYQFSQEGVISIDELLAFKLNYWFLIAAVLTFALMMFLKSLRFNILIKKSTGRSRPFLSYKVAVIGRHYDCITPMATGGQPFQVFYLNKRGLSSSTALSVPMAKYFTAQMAWLAVNIFVVVYALSNNTLNSSTIVLTISLISFILNFLMVFVLIISSISKRFGKLAVARILKFLEKMKLVKEYEKQFNKVMKTIDDFQESLKSFMKNIPSFIFLMILSIVTVIINYSIPFFIYSALIHYDPSMFMEIFVKAVMIEIAAGMIPIPGGSGMNEISFTALFAAVFTNGTLFWALIIWRLLNYYSFIIQGFMVILYDYFIGDKKYYWQKKKWELETESIDFRNKQLEIYKKKKRRKKLA